GELRRDLEADVLATLRVAALRVSESDAQPPGIGDGAARPPPVAPPTQPVEQRQGLLLPLVRLAALVGHLGLRRALGLGLLALGLLALLADQLRFLLDLDLGLLLDARRRQRGDGHLVGVHPLAERELDALRRR